MGHAMEYILTDIVARYQRMMGRDVFFLTGTDEHGSKIVKVSEEKGTTPKELCDKNANSFVNMKDLLQLSFDDFIRTTDQNRHWPSVTKMWKELVEKGDIYKGEYTGYYCVGCEAFITEKELEDGKCPVHKKEPDIINEENYFFKLSKYGDEIIELIESGRMKIIPEYRGREIVNVIKSGLHDVSFSRPKSSLKWGIPVPGDDTQVMYVWCDALTNYISALDYANEGDLYKKYWSGKGEKVHVIGKDILRFHAAIWPAMLLSAEIPLPDIEYVHGFMTVGGEKMSKSLGNYIGITESPQEIFGKIMSIPDAVMGDYFQLTLGYSEQEVTKLLNDMSRGVLHPRDLKARLGRELVTLYHNPGAARQAEEEFNRVFKHRELPDEVEEKTLSCGDGGIQIASALTQVGLAASGREARRLIGGGGVTVDGARVEKPDFVLGRGEHILKVGKRRFLKVILK